jgi:hypothetical protein
LGLDVESREAEVTPGKFALLVVRWVVDFGGPGDFVEAVGIAKTCPGDSLCHILGISLGIRSLDKADPTIQAQTKL